MSIGLCDGPCVREKIIYLRPISTPRKKMEPVFENSCNDNSVIPISRKDGKPVQQLISGQDGKTKSEKYTG
jgi:hypothetical protein